MKGPLVPIVAIILLLAVPPLDGHGMGGSSKWDKIQAAITYRLYRPGVRLRLRERKVTTITCAKGQEPWVAAPYGTSTRGFSLFEGHRICSFPVESTRIGNPTVMGVRAYLGVACDPTRKCTKSQGVRNGFIITWKTKPSAPYRKSTTIQLDSVHLTLPELMQVVRGLEGLV